MTSKRLLGIHIYNRDNRLVQQLAANLKHPEYIYIIPLEHTYKPLRKIFKRIDGAEIFRAS